MLNQLPLLAELSPRAANSPDPSKELFFWSDGFHRKQSLLDAGIELPPELMCVPEALLP